MINYKANIRVLAAIEPYMAHLISSVIFFYSEGV